MDRLGYSEKELASIPNGANLGLGCGNPTALASIHEGDVVLDLGAGAGIDCFLAAEKVGASGRVIGVDMTPEMVDQARKNAREGGYDHVEFRLGEIEHLPVADASVDWVISNCVVNLSVDKAQVFREAYRSLRSGGGLLVSDIVLVADLPEGIRRDPEAVAGCIAGAMPREDYLKAIEAAGFGEVEVLGERPVGRTRGKVASSGLSRSPRRARAPKTEEGRDEGPARDAWAKEGVFATSVQILARKGRRGGARL
jgi:SAM-dependent methyltransferase